MDRTIGPARYSNILTWFRGFQDKDIYFLLGTKRQKNLKRSRLQLWPESVGAVLEFWYIELITNLWQNLVSCVDKKSRVVAGVTSKNFTLRMGTKPFYS